MISITIVFILILWDIAIVTWNRKQQLYFLEYQYEQEEIQELDNKIQEKENCLLEISNQLDNLHGAILNAQELINSLRETEHCLSRISLQNSDKAKEKHKLNLTQQDINDIQLLRNLQINFSKKDIIDKLIWETYIKPAYDILMVQLDLSIGGQKSGIYKITDQKSGLAYVGQSVNLKERFRTHIKNGLTWTPQSNKLYQEMQKDGVENFTFHILEYTSKAKLNEREAYWIDFYNTKDCGLNGTRGNGT